MDITDTLTATYIPTMMFVARNQANATFSGKYRYISPPNSTVLPPSARNGTNSTASPGMFFPPNATVSLTISTSTDKPGLGVYDWVSNGVDMAMIAVAIGSNITKDYFDNIKPSVRLYPTTFEEKLPNGKGKRVAFKAVFEDVGLPEKKATMSTDCATWVGVTGVVYGKKPLDMFIFDFDESGRVVSLEVAALRVRMDKIS